LPLAVQGTHLNENYPAHNFGGLPKKFFRGRWGFFFFFFVGRGKPQRQPRGLGFAVEPLFRENEPARFTVFTGLVPAL